MARNSLPARAAASLQKAGLAPGDAASVSVEVANRYSIINLRGRIEDPGFEAAIRQATGLVLPLLPNRWSSDGPSDGARVAMWLGPDEWLIVASDADAATTEQSLRAARPDDPWLSVVDLSHSYAVLRIAGPCMRQLLAKGCPLDLHPRSFSNGSCAQSNLARARVLLRAVADGAAIEIWFRNSFANYLVAWLVDAAEEFREPSK